jgi:sigma-70-like protein
MNTPILLETLARQALAGDHEALDTLVRALQDDIYRLALRMLWNREDAEDATQEILVRIVTRLSQFGFRSQLKTWAYRLSVNYILDVKKSPIERLDLTFQRFADNLMRTRRSSRHRIWSKQSVAPAGLMQPCANRCSFSRSVPVSTHRAWCAIRWNASRRNIWARVSYASIGSIRRFPPR